VFIQNGHLIAFESKKLCGAWLRWPTHENELYVIVCCLKAWQYYLGMHKIKVYMDKVSLWYFEMQPRALVKQLRWHDTLALLDVELIHKPCQDNVIPDALSRKEEFQLEKPSTKP
jgi:hypothetical protein